MGKTPVSDDREPPVDVEEDKVIEGCDERDEVVGGRDFVDEDAVDEDEDGDEEDEDEGLDEFEKDGFVVDDVEEEQPVDSDDEEEKRDKNKKKKRRRNKEKRYVLEEEEYELFGLKDRKRFKRLKKAQSGAGEGSSRYANEEQLKRSLFGDAEEAPLEDVDEEEEEEKAEDDAEIGEDEMADFIVEDEIHDNGAPVRRRSGKKHMSAPGISSYGLQDAHDIFGDVDELLQLRKQLLDTSEGREKKLEDEFEPVVLLENYATEKDFLIRKTDVPERIQISEESTGSPPIDEISVDVESSWIYNQLVISRLPLFSKRGAMFINKEDIMRFLRLHHAQKLDIPFIAMYRKEECPSLFKDPEELEVNEGNQNKNERTPTLKWHKVLWTIRDLDRKWLLLQKRKSALQLHYDKRFEEESYRVSDETRRFLNQQLFESIFRALMDAESDREVDDVDSKFRLHFPAGEGVDEGQYKRPKRKSRYSICSKAGLWKVANKFGISSEQFGMQLYFVKMRENELEDAKETPEEIASNFTCAMFETSEAVLKAARHMAAVEISCEPRVRKYVRSQFMENAVVSTNPTPDGDVAIDPFHQYAGVKWLREKPMSIFEGAQWLLIQKAEEEKLLQVTIKLPDRILNKLIEDCDEYYLSMGVSKSAKLWNEQRKLILQDALFGFLLPSMEKEARSLLTSRSKSWLVLEFGKDLWNKVSVGPYQRKENDISSDDEHAPRVMACCWGPGNPATTFVMIDSSGEVLDVLCTGSLTLQSQNTNDQQRKENDQQRVLKFMTDHQPHVVVLGAANLSCTRLKDDIYEIIFKMVEENPRDVGDEMDGITIVYGDESLPRLYENSPISSDQLQGQSGIVKRAVALGRYLQNPLAMVATLCGPGREILSWKLSSLENFLTPDEKYGMVEQVMVDVTNQVGVDINLAANHEWLFAPLQFISGLGPRKAASLQRSLARAGMIFSRKDFLVLPHGLARKVFVNAIGFLRVRYSGLAASSSHDIDLLDNTRIHPESYGLAQELAKLAYEEEFTGEENNDEDVLEMAIEHVRDRPDRLKALEVEKYAKDSKQEKKVETIYDTIRELINGFQDPRKQYEEPSQDEEFYMISGETEDTLSEGRTVQATVRRVQTHRAICVLESGLTGMLMKEDYSDDWRNIVELPDCLRQGDSLTCKIKSIQKNRYQVFLLCMESEMRSNRYQSVQNLDPYYHEDRSMLQSEQQKAHKEKELAKKHFKPRVIFHPRFQNVAANEAMEFLSDKGQGEFVFHPSSRGPSYLTLTLKICDGVYAHKDIVEGGKDPKDITSLLRIGNTLTIGEHTFQDLDEVVYRYVDPLVGYLNAMVSYRKFRRGTKDEVDKLLRIEKSENPMTIVYGFGISHEHPGSFILTHLRTTNPHHEYIGLYPEGFKFRKRMFKNIDMLVGYIKTHLDHPQHDSAQSFRSAAAMVPMRGSAPTGAYGTPRSSGGWGGSTYEGGWR